MIFIFFLAIMSFAADIANKNINHIFQHGNKEHYFCL